MTALNLDAADARSRREIKAYLDGIPYVWDEETRLGVLGYLHAPHARQVEFRRQISEGSALLSAWFDLLEEAPQIVRDGLKVEILRSLSRPLAPAGTVEVFHFTSQQAWEGIDRDGLIRPRNPIVNRWWITNDDGSAIDWRDPDGFEPLVVWLTTVAEGSGVRISTGEPEVRIMVRLPAEEVHPFLSWAGDPALEVPVNVYLQIIKELDVARDYYVIERGIPREEWVDASGDFIEG